MELEWDSRPVSMVHQSQWPSANSNPSYPSTSLGQRRRSSIVHAPPALPPPTQPIPSVPVLHSNYYDEYDVDLDNNGATSSSLYARPHASANLAAVAAFSQARNYIPSQPYASTSTADVLNDSPPRSMLRPSPSYPKHHDTATDRLLLPPPPEPKPTTAPRPSSRRALTRALELAREAVKLDSTNDDPHGAIIAYGKSVALLNEVMERVMRGEDSTESHRRRNGRRRSVVAQEEEVRRLKSIHDTYADRMNILSLIYSIPPPTDLPSSSYAPSYTSTSTTSTQPSSPVSVSPSSDTSDPTPHTPSATGDVYNDFRQSPDGALRANGEGSDDEGEDMIGTALFTFDTSAHTTPGPLSPTKVATVVPAHPYAAASPQAPDAFAPTSSLSAHGRLSTIPPARPAPSAPLPSAPLPPPPLGMRPRASSTLPPPPPPPLISPPPAPLPASLDTPPEQATAGPHNRHLDVGLRPRGNSTTAHKRTSSGSRLAALREEGDRTDDRSSQSPQPQEGEEELRRARGSSAPTSINRDSHPLPPLPSPRRQESLITPRVSPPEGEPRSPDSSTFITPRTNGSSAFSTRADSAPSPVPLINASTNMGTISQRRSKTSAPPSMSGSPTPPDHILGTNAPPPLVRLTPTLPSSTVASLGIGRSRSSSQPGRRPSLVGQPAPADHNGRPPLPMANGGLPAGAPRKPSIPSKLNPMTGPLQLSINTALLSPPLSSTLSLVPPPPMLPGNLPTTPTSPLPPAPPNDPMRKPYHLMNMLRHTMSSKSGGYITRRLHVPQEVWSQGGVKLNNIPEKIRVVEVLCSALEDVEKCSAEFFGAGNVSTGQGLGIGSVGRKEGEAWAAKLEEFSGICDHVVANFGKKLGVGEGFVLKKTSGVTSWGGKLTRQFDKFTNGKNLDSPTTYVQGLNRLFTYAQLLDEHTKAALCTPMAPTYAALPMDIRMALDIKLRHSSEFFARVVLTFVVRDLSLLLDKYAKKCEKWLAE
ncbi:hypothetical protein JAAARDRAFT_29888 [Jaapia argillacea MUCL 33604]|uniref:MIT domain-containing protein n=1 Tax=Jaapia argillacea MUCL 33604 TaxID=933084 RepID=A0A067QCG2_9AGAM|nr:hypothetical protein JAAARDRAFT_29888 [Jaapia argillacea MUCL 33604]